MTTVRHNWHPFRAALVLVRVAVRCALAASPGIALLAAQSAPEPPSKPASVREAVQRSLPLLQSSADTWYERRSCSSCHHQGLGGLAISVAHEAGFAVDTVRMHAQARRVLAPTAGWLERYVTFEASINEPIGQSYRAVGMAAGGHPASPVTDAIVHLVAAQQHTSGRWGSGSRRPPHEDSDFTATALTIRTLQLYAPVTRREEMTARIARARRWLQAATPVDNEDRVMQLLGLAWSGQRDALDPFISALRAEQREDGGWAQIPTRASDAYATGQALVALQQAGGVDSDDAAIQRGLRFLVETQYADGSWHVRTRRTASPGLPYFETGYPHGRDQFISYAGAAWATMALSLAQTSARSAVLMGPLAPRFAVRSDSIAASGLTPFMHTALSGALGELASRLQAGADVNERSPSGVTALMCAVHDSAKTKLLLESGADPNLVTRSGHSALLLAAATDGASASVRLLLAHGANVDQAAQRSNHAGVAALGRAIARGDTALALALVEAGARIDGPPRAEVPPLLNAVFFGDAVSAAWLMRHGANPNGSVTDGETPLMIAATDGRTEVVRVLLQAGANVHATDRDGFTALHFAAESADRGNLAVVELLLAAGADASRPTKAGETPAMLADRWDKQDVRERLARRP
jgi:ankyrin repeat protein